MARGTQLSFIDALQGMTGQIMQLAGAPDADVEFLLELRDLILGRIGVEQEVAAEQALQSMGAGMGAGPMPISAPPGGMPVTDAGVSRGPTPGLDTSGAQSALEQAMAG